MATLHARSSWKWVTSRNGNSDSPEDQWFRWRVNTHNIWLEWRLTGVVGHHRNITSTFVTKKMYGVILDKMDYELALIIRDIEQNFQYVISYEKLGGLNIKCLRCGLALMRLHMTTYLVCLKQLCTKILKVLMIHTVYRACQGAKHFAASFLLHWCICEGLHLLPSCFVYWRHFSDREI